MKTLTDKIYVKNSFEDLPSLVIGYPQVFCVYDTAVRDYIEEVKKSGSIIACEEQKTIETVLGISAWLLENNANRNDLLITIGGGITSDMEGFAASIYKREKTGVISNPIRIFLVQLFSPSLPILMLRH